MGYIYIYDGKLWENPFNKEVITCYNVYSWENHPFIVDFPLSAVIFNRSMGHGESKSQELGFRGLNLHAAVGKWEILAKWQVE